MKRKKFLRMTNWMLILPLILMMILVSSASAENFMPGKGVTVQPARATWTTGFFLEAIYSGALEQ